jgi:hypothetical protein
MVMSIDGEAYPESEAEATTVTLHESSAVTGSDQASLLPPAPELGWPLSHVISVIVLVFLILASIVCIVILLRGQGKEATRGAELQKIVAALQIERAGPCAPMPFAEGKKAKDLYVSPLQDSLADLHKQPSPSVPRGNVPGHPPPMLQTDHRS